nr:UL16-binding protein 1-like [Chlorocebus sabaeus]XP_037851707.1 UL16-binding protein 1-like [Chlorocebus sabaeus]
MAVVACPAFLPCFPLLLLQSGWSGSGQDEPHSWALGTTQPKTMATTLSPWSLLLIILCFILPGI